ncbi:MAG: hypothetical protein M0R70_04335 [Nitrospirae bacterium]|nr:hypothetical protein [Nitrospirota bacterium]
MRSEIKGYFLKEYGAWSVLIIVFLIGVGVSRAFSWTLIPLFLSLGLLINSKQALTKWLRRTEDRMSLAIFLGQIVIATVILLAIFNTNIPGLLPLLIFPGAYLLMNKFAGEHFILTEVLGFTLISLAAVIAKFLITGGLDVRLFVGVALYFTAGVFKIKAILLRKTSDRVLTGLHVVLAAYLYYHFNITLVILLPLIENLVMAATLYKVRLQTTGWIEVAKSLTFLGLFIAYF